jgi:ABC-2 type transport system ATP-binding protein
MEVAEVAATARTSTAALALESVSRTFGEIVALDQVSVDVAPGEIHAILGPNGAGKTTLLRIMVGLTDADRGTIRLEGKEMHGARPRSARRSMGLVPSGDRSLYLRLTGSENLVFFARLQGMSRRAANERARSCLADVGLTDAAGQRATTYSHRMQKRLAIARALLTRPPILLFDEATHDLDPLAAEQVRALVTSAAMEGTAVVWTTQRVEEIRGFADRVTLLDGGSVRFQGSVPALMAHGITHRYLVQLSGGDGDVSAQATAALGEMGSVVASDETSDSYLMSLRDTVVLGDAISALTRAGVEVHACRQERPEIEGAFLSLTEERR